MRIGFDAKRALNNATGLGNYSRILLNALMRQYPEHEYLLFSPRTREELYHNLYGKSSIIAPGNTWNRTFHPWWRSLSIVDQLRTNRVDLYHGLSNELPLNIYRTGIPSVVTIHDLIFLKHREQYPFIDRKIYEFKTRRAAEQAKRVIAVSQETKRDLMKFYKTPEEKITVIHPAVEPAFYTPAATEQITALKAKYNLPEKYLLHVSAFFPRKNHKKIIEAFDLIHERVPEDLILVGSAGTQKEILQLLISQKKSGKRIRMMEGISNAELPALYQGASVFVYPSLYEGFGMPVLEALASRIPVVTTGGGSMQEAGGKDSLYVNPFSAGEIAEAITWILANPVLQKPKTESGYAHALSMRAEVIAQKTMKVYQDLVKAP